MQNKIYRYVINLLSSVFFIIYFCIIVTTIFGLEFVFLRASDKPLAYTAPKDNRPQFVVFSFDGSKSLEMWKETRQFARDMAMEGKTLKFTYFISGVYFLTENSKTAYFPPAGKSIGASAIGFSDSEEDINERIKEVNRAIYDGHEIASHANGHFDGSRWTMEDWTKELKEFTKLIFNAKDHSASVIESVNLKPSDIVGFRAPELGINKNAYKALKELGYIYDSSGISRDEDWPKKDENGIWHFPLSEIKLGNYGRTISMDYNLYFLHSRAKDIAKKGTPLWQKMYEDAYGGYKEYFDRRYRGTRAPVFIADHFAKWNDGVYWEAMKGIASDVCGKVDVRCVTFRDLVDYLEHSL